jgi:hypothetical protein
MIRLLEFIEPLLLSMSFLIGSNAAASAPFHVGVVTGTISQFDEDFRGANALIKEYGAVESGGMIQHLTYPDNFMFQLDAYIDSVVALAEDTAMKAIVVNQAIPGTAEAFKRVHSKRPDIYCLAGETQEDPTLISSSADLVVSQDFLSRGYTIVWAAKQMRAKTLVHVSFSRHLSYEIHGRRCTIMEGACKELGVTFASETARDPISDSNWGGDSFPILGQVRAWLKKYGSNGAKVAFFCTNEGYIEPIIRVLLESKNGMFVEADWPSPLIGYPGALGLDLKAEQGDFSEILHRVETAVVAKGGAGRFGAWAYPYGFTVTAGLGEYAIRVLSGKARKNNLHNLLAAYGKWTPGANWNGAYYTDASTGMHFKNMALVYMDTYILGGLNGKSFLSTTRVKVPEKYLTLKSKYATH